MIVASCPLRISLFGGSTDNPHFVKKYGYGSVISFTCDLKTYVTLSQDKFGFNKDQNEYIINYSKREQVCKVSEIKNEVVRVVLEHFNMPPVHVTLFSDAYSQGSGLASSSSYIISLIKACSLFLNIEMSDFDICKLAYNLELKFNPYCGYQDPYGCGIGGFKRIEFYNENDIKYQYLSPDIFEKYDTHLIFTGVTRNSKNILEDVTKNIDKVLPLLDTVDKSYSELIDGKYYNFLDLFNEGWKQKKSTSSFITENPKIEEIDNQLENNSSVLAHKLCGAGNGGFFLVFSDKDQLTIPYPNVKIRVVFDGVVGESI